MIVPSKWSECSLEKGMMILSNPITSGQTMEQYAQWVLELYVDDTSKLTLESRTKYIGDILNLISSNPKSEYNDEFIIYGKRYKLDKNLANMNWGWFLDMETLLTNAESGNIWEVMDKIIASLLRPVTYKGTFKKIEIIEPYNSDNLFSRADIFKKALTVDDIFGISLFFYLIAMTYTKKMIDSFLPNSVNEVTQMNEQMNTEKYTA